jgi:hypothetical protein
MVLVNNIFPGKQICIKQEIFIVSVRKAHGSKYCKFDSTNVYLGQYEELDEDKVINRAIKESAKYIADVSIN